MKIPNRQFLAQYGHSGHHDKLVHDTDEGVRALVAENGTDEHRTKLMNDPEHYVRMYVAINGSKDHAVHLMQNDTHPTVRTYARRRVTKFKAGLA